MTGKLLAGIVCGAAAAVPGQYMLTMLMAGLTALMRDEDALEQAAMVAPYAVAAMVIFICAIAPTVIGAWLRGCLVACAVSAILTVQALQCFGIGWLVGTVVDDRGLRDAAMAGCAQELTPTVTAVAAAIAVAAGIGAIVVWRIGARASVEDY